MVVWLLVACTDLPPPPAPPWTTGDSASSGDTAPDSASDSGTDSAGDTDGDTAEDTGEPDPWDDPAFWTSTSLLDTFLDLSLTPAQPHFEVRMVEADETWTTFSAPVTIAWSVSSLDLLVLDGGLVLLASIDPLALDDPADAGLSRLYAFLSADGDTWGTTMIEVTGTASGRLTDPSLFVTDEGVVRAVYYSTPEGSTGDPANLPGDHELRVAERDGATFFELPDVVLAAERLVDPVICRGDDAWHAFATQGSGVMHALGDTPDAFEVDDAFQWTGYQVPFCSAEAEGFSVVAQAGGGSGPPSSRRVDAAGVFSPEVLLWPAGDEPFGEDDCTSPVLGTLHGRNLMFCAVGVD